MASAEKVSTWLRNLSLRRYPPENLPWPYIAFLRQGETCGESHRGTVLRLRSTRREWRQDHQSVELPVQRICVAEHSFLLPRSLTKWFCQAPGGRTVKCGRL